MAPIFVQSQSLAGLGAAPRTEISEQQWTQQVNAQWAAAHPVLSKLPMGGNMLGIGLLVAGAISYGLGKKTLGVVLGLGGAALTVAATVTTASWNQASPFTIGSQPGIAGIQGMV